MGFATKQWQDEEVITRVRPFDLLLADERRWRQVLRARIHPPVERLLIRKIVLYNGRGIAYIFVPPQGEELKPFMLYGAFSKKRLRSQSITIPTRAGIYTEYDGPASIHARITAGRVALAQLERETGGGDGTA